MSLKFSKPENGHDNNHNRILASHEHEDNQNLAWWDKKKQLSTDELRRHLREYEFGMMSLFYHGNSDHVPKRAQRVAFFGDPHVGKSGLINSLLHSFEAWNEYHEVCKLSASGIIGTYDFIGPIHLLDRRQHPPRPVLDLYDTAGFDLSKRTTEIVEVIGEAVTGLLRPGSRLIFPSQRPILITESNRQWDGIDLAVLVAKFDNEPGIAKAIQLYSELNAARIKCMIVLTHAGNETTNRYISNRWGHVRYFCVENLAPANYMRNEVANRRFLELIAIFMEALEQSGKGVPDLSINRKFYKIQRKFVEALHHPAVKILIGIIAAIVLLKVFQYLDIVQ